MTAKGEIDLGEGICGDQETHRSPHKAGLSSSRPGTGRLETCALCSLTGVPDSEKGVGQGCPKRGLYELWEKWLGVRMLRKRRVIQGTAAVDY